MADDAISARIKELEDELKNTKYNKRTQHHIGLVKAKIATLKEKAETRKKSKGKTEGYTVRRSGDATVILVGYPSVGKSTLLNALTNAESKVAAYAFTTLTVIPGVMEYRNAKIQILDVPGILQGAADGTGRGREVLSVVRSSDLVIILLDINQLYHYPVILKELYDSGARVNQSRPNVVIKKTAKDGIRVGATVPLDIDEETVSGILKEFKINNANVLIRSRINEDEFIDCIEGNKKYLPAITVINKMDMASEGQIEEARSRYPDALFVSAELRTNVEILKETIFRKLDMKRIYLKEPGKKADLDEPMIIKRDSSTLRGLCDKLHKDFVMRFRFARIWGKSVKFEGQKITKLDHELSDGDIIELHIR